MNNNLISQNDSFLKSIQLLDAYNEWVYSHKKRISSFLPAFFSDIKIYFLGKIISYSTIRFISTSLNQEVEITNLNYNIYKKRENVLREIVENHKRNTTELKKHDLSNMSWSLKSMLSNFNKIYLQIEKYADLIKEKLDIFDIQVNKEINDLMKIEEFDLDKPYFYERKVENIVFLDTEESAEELVQLLTK